MHANIMLIPVILYLPDLELNLSVAEHLIVMSSHEARTATVFYLVT